MHPILAACIERFTTLTMTSLLMLSDSQLKLKTFQLIPKTSLFMLYASQLIPKTSLLMLNASQLILKTLQLMLKDSLATYYFDVLKTNFDD